MKNTKWTRNINLSLLILLMIVLSNCQSGYTPIDIEEPPTDTIDTTDPTDPTDPTAIIKEWPNEPLRGFCVGKPDVAMTTEAIFKNLKDWNINVIAVNLTYDENLTGFPGDLPAVPANMEPYRGVLDRLDKVVALAKKNHIYIILTGDHSLGSDRINVANGETPEENEVQERAYIKNVIDLHLYLSEKYSKEPVILGYNFISEPHSAWVVNNWQTEVVPSFINAIRAVDKETYFIFSSGLWGFPGGFSQLTPFDDPAKKTLYGFHMYAPHNYTHQGIGNRPRDLVYPGMLKMFDGSELLYWNKEELRNYMKPAFDFKKKYNVRMFVGEFSAVRWAPGGGQWSSDACDLLEEQNIDWTYHAYTGWNGWNPTFSAEAKGSTEPDGGVETPTMQVLKEHWLKNTSFLPE